jgi:glutamate--cysteine ligase
VKENIAAVIEYGRDPELRLLVEGEQTRLTEWADKLLKDINHSAVLLDEVHNSTKYCDSGTVQKAKVADPDLTPSGQVLKTMQDEQLSFYHFAMKQSEKHKNYFLASDLDKETRSHMQGTSVESVRKQNEIEMADEISFDEFLKRWNAG